MKATIETTSEFRTVHRSDGKPVRVRLWNGISEKGERFTALIIAISPLADHDGMARELNNISGQYKW